MEQAFLLSRGDLSIPCKLNLPAFGQIRRVVLGVHGLGGSICDSIQESLAEEMTLFSSAVFRFDFPAHGENPAEELTLDGCTRTLLAVAQCAKEKYPEIEELCIFATGLGAFVTLCCLPELTQLPGKLRLVVQTPPVLLHNTLLRMTRLTQEDFQRIGAVTFPTARPLTVTYKFYKELMENAMLIPHPIPMLILHGQEDSYIPMGDIQNFRRINEGSQLVIIPGTSHRFQEDGAWDMVLDLVRDWFEFQQVLLLDSE